MSGCVYFEGNAYIDGGNITTTTIGNCSISTSSLDMNNQNITSVKDPIQQQDAATKQYVDDLGIRFNNALLNGITSTEIFPDQKGSFVITITNIIIDGPSAIFNVTKNRQNSESHIARTVASPGYGTNTLLQLLWPPNSGIMLSKTDNNYNGEYRVKIM
jgi:hypothetical protein